MPYDYFVLEKLTGIRNKNRGRKQNKRLANWSYFQQELFLAYKLEAVGKKMEYVDARYTSQRCSQCGFTAKSNRAGGIFECSNCGHKMHADLNASINIRDSFLSHHLYGEQGVCQASIMRRGQYSASRRACPGGT
jgi:IS605 OrfB family transposase